MVPVYRRFDKYMQKTVKAAYFNDYCAAQIGVTWDEAMKVFQAFRYGYPMIQEYWHALRMDFYAWAEENGIRGWGVHLFPDE